MNKIEKELFNHMNSYRKKHKVYTYLEFVDMVIASTMDKRWTYDLDKVSGDFIFETDMKQVILILEKNTNLTVKYSVMVMYGMMLIFSKQLSRMI